MSLTKFFCELWGYKRFGVSSESAIVSVDLPVMDTTYTTIYKVFLLKTIAANKFANLAHSFPSNFVTMPPPS